MSHLSRGNTPGGPRSWTGSLIQNKRDLTGLLYMRNRYYDPKTGRFTQEDPIGLAGGLNTYGFADGDPVSYTDPYGLSAEGNECPPRCSPQDWENAARRTGQKVAPVQPYISAAYQTILALFPGGGVASFGARATRSVGATRGTVTLYRAVGQREFSALAGTGTFSAGGGSLGGKWFATSADNAEIWGARMFKDEPYRIVSATVPEKSLVQMIRQSGRYDGIGPAAYAELRQLGDAIVDVVK